MDLSLFTEAVQYLLLITQLLQETEVQRLVCGTHCIRCSTALHGLRLALLFSFLAVEVLLILIVSFNAVTWTYYYLVERFHIPISPETYGGEGTRLVC